jgi:hypothetical protein
MDQISSGKWIIAPVFAAVLGLAAGEVRAQAAVDTNNTVIADFESNLQSTMWNGYWYHFDDANSVSAADSTLYGNSVITSLDSLGNPFYDTSGYYDKRTYPLGHTGEADSHSSRMAFKLGDRLLSCGAACSYQPYVGWGLVLTTYRFNPADTFDLTGATAISFWAKSDTDTVTVDYSLFIRDTSNAPDYSQAIKIGPQWTKYTISLNPATTKLQQPTWAAKKPFDLRHVAGMGFGFNRGENSKFPTNGMSIDDITIENWKYVEPPIIDGIRSWSRASASRAGYRLQIKGSQVHLIRADGNRITPFNLNGRAFPAR